MQIHRRTKVEVIQIHLRLQPLCPSNVFRCFSGRASRTVIPMIKSIFNCIVCCHSLWGGTAYAWWLHPKDADQPTSFTNDTKSRRCWILIRQLCLKIGYLLISWFYHKYVKLPFWGTPNFAISTIGPLWVWLDLRTSQVIKQIELERRKNMVQLSFSVNLG